LPGKVKLPGKLLKTTMSMTEICLGNEFAATVMEKLILRAMPMDGFVYLNGEPIFLKKGQAICNRFELANCFGIKRSQSGRIQRILSFLEKTVNLISKQKHRNCSIITIINNDLLDGLKQQNEQSIDNQQTIYRQSIDNQKTTKRQSKDNQNSFEKFWEIYPKKRAKVHAMKVFAKINPSEELLETMISKIKTEMTSEEWLKDGGTFIPYAATWLNGKRWLDEEFKPKISLTKLGYQNRQISLKWLKDGEKR